MKTNLTIVALAGVCLLLLALLRVCQVGSTMKSTASPSLKKQAISVPSSDGDGK